MKDLVLKGNIKEIVQQWQGLIVFYGTNATIKEIAENEFTIAQSEGAND